MGKAETASTVDELASALGVDRTTVYRWKNDWGLDDLFDETGGGWKVSEVREWAKDMKRARRAVLRPGLDGRLWRSRLGRGLPEGKSDPRNLASEADAGVPAGPRPSRRAVGFACRGTDRSAGVAPSTTRTNAGSSGKRSRSAGDTEASVQRSARTLLPRGIIGRHCGPSGSTTARQLQASAGQCG